MVTKMERVCSQIKFLENYTFIKKLKTKPSLKIKVNLNKTLSTKTVMR